MNLPLRHDIFTSALVLFGTISCLAEGGPANVVEVESGTAIFTAATNVPGVEVKGKSTTLSARVEVSPNADGLLLEGIEASLPVKSLLTGMKVRDEHMRKYIFTAPDGKEPDLRFAAGTAACPASGASHEFACQLAGSLTIRGVSRPANINLHVKEQAGSTSTYRVEGDGTVKLSDYGIAAPSQFGVRPADEVKLRLEFSARTKPPVNAKAEGAK
jgi:polyisoprenoid-binding protein YceI